MAKNQLRSGQLGDQEVKRADLNDTTTGSAVIKKAVQGKGISISSSGVDSGTGDVTFNNTATLVQITNSDTGGISLTLGMVVRYVGSGQVSRAASVSGFHKVVGFAVETIGLTASGWIQTSGILDGLSGLTAGDKYFVGTTLGTMDAESAYSLPASGDYVVPVGRALSSSRFLISIGEPIRLRI